MLRASTINNFASLIGRSPAMEATIRTAQIAAATDVHVLIEGETGTGKELLAREIQASSRRADKPFIIVNCSALPHELVESLMFGHEKGAFTGAHERKDGFAKLIAQAMETQYGTDAEDVQKLLSKAGFTRELAKRAAAIAQQKGAFTLWSVVDALTQLSRDTKFAGTRKEADQKASSLLSLVAA